MHGRDRTGAAVAARARLVVGADGVRSTVAREAGAATLRVGARRQRHHLRLLVRAAASTGYEWFYRPGYSAGMIPTNDGEVCVFAGVPARPHAADCPATSTAPTTGSSPRPPVGRCFGCVDGRDAEE